MKNLSLYHKFVFAIICVGLIPMVLLSTVIFNRMMEEYQKSLEISYERAAGYASDLVENMLSSYNEITKTVYYYGRGNMADVEIQAYDNLRKIIDGEGYAPELLEQSRAAAMEDFLKNMQSVDGYITSTSMIAEDSQGELLPFHYSAVSKYFRGEEEFLEAMGYAEWDRESKELIVIPTHENTYYNPGEYVFTVARNYFDLRMEVGMTEYIGTVFLDIGINKLEVLFSKLDFSDNDIYYLLDGEENCLFSNAKGAAGSNISGQLKERDGYLQIVTPTNEYGLKLCVYVNTEKAFAKIQDMQHVMYVFIGLSLVLLLGSSMLFSRRLVRPIHRMMAQMEAVEGGNFDIELPVESGDEIGILSKRFNEMSLQLKNYINQSYVAQIKQKEAELTALKSQIIRIFCTTRWKLSGCPRSRAAMGASRR